MRPSTPKILIPLLFALLLTVACGKLTPENYGKLKMSMPYDDVVTLIGSPDKCDGAMGIKDCIWGGEKKHINVKFLNENVIFFTGKGL
ncbi:MAG: DUF3862 domain-containing protein [Desulfatitalea sp.]|nr:DUF3862 domain-containing protein [Desulfatitalea sp.]